MVPSIPNGVVTYPVESGSALPHDNMELIGSRFGHIRIVDILGQGGMGDVYAGYDETLQRRVALKAIRREQRLDAEARSRLIREARTLSQLEHPNICRIYEYIEGNEVDLLVLELIEGKTLEEELRHGISPAQKLRIADAIARVLVAAHRAGIIHRDLKPENVMLTPAGEVKVLDFGLARWAEKPQSPSGEAPSVMPAESLRSQLLLVAEKKKDEWLPLEDSSATLVVPTVMVMPTPDKKRDRGLLTAAGVTMGTPLYMSPEQARGETLTPASDMYSFGLLLQTLFTGREPYDSSMSGREVMLAASRGESLPVTDASRDITALIERLKQLAPTDRPTAVEALDRLRWIADRPKRLVRELTAALVLSVVVLSAWKYVTDLRRERAAAVAAETEARARRAQAEDLIGFMLGDLRKKLEPVGRLEVLNDVAAKALQYVGSKSKESLSVRELIDHSKALNQLGEVRMAQGDMRAAMPLFDRSLDLSRTASQRVPHDSEASFALALSHFWVGNDFRVLNDVEHALPHIRAYLAIVDRLARQNPDNDTYEREVAYAHTNLGLLLEAKKNFVDALTEYRVALAIKQAVAARAPGDAALQDDVARAINKIAYVLQRAGDLAGARRQFETEVEMRERLARLDPKQMRWKQDLAISHSMLSGLLESMGDSAAALEHRRADVALHAELCAFDPTNVSWRRNWAIGRAWLAGLLAADHKPDEALKEIAAAETVLRALSAGGTERATSDLVAIETTYAHILTVSGDPRAARSKALEAIRLAERSATKSPYRVAAALLQLGNAELSAGHPGAAADAWLLARTTLQPDAPALELRQLETWARILISVGDRRAADPIVRRTRELGYRNIEFQEFCQLHGY